MELNLNGTGAAASAEPEHENVLAGAVGAFLFALAGGAVWVILNRIGIIAGISGLIAVVCAIKGYSIFAKCESKKGIIISVIMAVLVIVMAWYACLALDFHDATKLWYAEGELEMQPSYFDCVRGAYELLSEREIAGEYFKDLAIGLFFCIIASVSYIVNYSKKISANQLVESAQNSLDAVEPFDENGGN